MSVLSRTQSARLADARSRLRRKTVVVKEHERRIPRRWLASDALSLARWTEAERVVLSIAAATDASGGKVSRDSKACAARLCAIVEDSFLARR